MNDGTGLLIPALAAALVSFLWQGALVGVAAWAALRALRRARPQLRYLVACAALLLCVVLPVAGVATAIAAADATAADPRVDALPTLAMAATDGVRVLATARLPSPPQALLAWIVAAWAAGALLVSLRLAMGLAWMRRACRDARPEDGPLQACVSRLSHALGLRRPVQLRLCDHGDGPVVAGWWKPVVLLPLAVAARVPAPLLEALLAHELAHVRRHDYLVNLLQGLVEALLFYHPVTWWLSRRIRAERELVADDLAARALGDGRRLALALSELDRLQAAQPAPRPAFHLSHIAHAALGGHLMPRIRQLVRPDRPLPRAAAAVPVVLLLAAGAGAYAHARGERADEDRTAAVPVAASPTRPVTAAAPADSRKPASADARVAIHRAPTQRSGETPYALVRGGDAGIVMSGDLDDIDDIRAAGRGGSDEYLWFRRDGRAWTVRDPGLLAQARDARREDDALSAQMRALDARMRPHSRKMEALGLRMEALGGEMEAHSPDMEAESDRMQALGTRMEALGRQQEALASQRVAADGADRTRVEARMRELDGRQQALSGEMERHSQSMARLSERMHARQAPMEALGRQMEDASRPMESIGREMEALGSKIEARAAVSNAAIARLIDEAWRRGLATPAPARQ